MKGADIGGSVVCAPHEGHRTEIGGMASLARAKVGGAVGFHGAQIVGNLDLQGAVIGNVLCDLQDGQRTEIGGMAFLEGAKVARDVLFGGVLIEGFLIPGMQDKGGLLLQNAQIGGSVSCQAVNDVPTEIRGATALTGAKVVGDVSLGGVLIAGALDLTNAEIRGKVACLPCNGRATAIGGDVSFRSAHIESADLDGRICPKGNLDLTLTRVSHLEIREELPLSIGTHGLQFQQLLVPGHGYLRFLEVAKPFDKGVYRFMENWFRNRGEDEQARQVYLAMRRRDRRDGRMNVPTRLGDWFLDWTVGYGLKSYRLLAYLIVMFVLTTVLFAVDRQSVTPPPGSTGEWTEWDAPWMALRINVPVVNVGVKSGWLPSPRPIPWLGITYEAYAGWVSLLSWIAVPLFLAGISGILKKEK
jgi:hypothetical protein